jgi:hypothetical protein
MKKPLRFLWGIFLLLILLSSTELYGQDTISIYFETGISKLPDKHLKTLNAIPVKYFLSEVDSIHYVGMADSVGNLESNLNLSEKRARNVADYCGRLIPKNIPSKILALGERLNPERYKNRRVDVVLYFPQATKEEPGPSPDTINLKPKCYNIDYALLHRSLIRKVTKRKKEMIIIIADPQYFDNMNRHKTDNKKETEYYYGSVSKEGNFMTYKLKWSRKNTGNYWWSNSQYTALIPKKDFDRFKIFKISDPTCDTCSEDFQNQVSMEKEDKCLQVDRFLMKNIQFKMPWFNNRWAKIRAPREFVDPDDRYFIGCNSEIELKWETKKAKRKQNYYYSRLPRSFDHMANITRLMDCCKLKPEPSECDKALIFISDLGAPDNSFVFFAEPGCYFQQSKFTPYCGFGLSKEGNLLRGSFMIGTDIDLSLCGSLRFQYHFVSFPFSMLNPVRVWQSPNAEHVIERYGRLYLGTELKTRFNDKGRNYLEQNIHLGLAIVHTSIDAFLPRIFIQYGVGYDYLRISSSKLNSVVQLGLDMRIGSIKRKYKWR